MVLVLPAAVRPRPRPNTALRDGGLYASPFETSLIDRSSTSDGPCLEHRSSLSVSIHRTAVGSYGLLSVIAGVSAGRVADTPVNRYSRPYQPRSVAKTERRTLVLPPVGDDPHVGRDDRQGTCGGVSETRHSLTNCTVSDTDGPPRWPRAGYRRRGRSNSHESTTGPPSTRSLHELSRRVLGQATGRAVQGEGVPREEPVRSPFESRQSVMVILLCRSSGATRYTEARPELAASLHRCSH